MTVKDEILKQVPQALADKHVPALKTMFAKYVEAVTVLTTAQQKDPLNFEKDPAVIALRDEYHQMASRVYEDFALDGGTKEQWNILAPAVHYGHFGP